MRRTVQKYMLCYQALYSNQQIHENRYRLAENPRKVFANRKAAPRQFSLRSKRRLENSATHVSQRPKAREFHLRRSDVVACPNDVKFSKNEPIARRYLRSVQVHGMTRIDTGAYRGKSVEKKFEGSRCPFPERLSLK